MSDVLECLKHTVVGLGCVTLLALSSGCGRNPSSAVILKIGDTEYTQGMINTMIEGQYRLFTLNHQFSVAQVGEIKTELTRRVCLEMPVRTYLARQYPANRELSTEELNQHWSRYAGKFGLKNQKLADFRQQVQDAGVTTHLRHQIEVELKSEYVLNTIYSNELSVTQADLDRLNGEIDAFFARIAATNRLLYAEASNAWHRLERGEPFARVADECSQDSEKDPGGDWGEKTVDDFQSESLAYRTAIEKLAEGDYTRVLESETGLEIIRKLENVPAIKANCGVDCWHLARIFIRRAYIPERESEAELRSEIFIRKRVKFMSALADRLMKEGIVAYPKGRKAFLSNLPPEVVEKLINPKGEK